MWRVGKSTTREEMPKNMQELDTSHGIKSDENKKDMIYHRIFIVGMYRFCPMSELSPGFNPWTGYPNVSCICVVFVIIF